MKYRLTRANSFKRSFKKQNLKDTEEALYIEIVYKLLNGEELEAKYQDHPLKGNLKAFRECHIRPDLLLIYRIHEDKLELVDIGSHSDLFE
ncbi:MAG: type II toxin-antitoxin system YafQ family toxin [Campylobacterales bacterium]|nr:type II toxin-antitoxin system YafQ family toxin [Campylobacterales bacterium]